MVGLDLPRQKTRRDMAKDLSLTWADLLKRCLSPPSDSTQYDYSLHSHPWCFTEALELEGMNQGLDFWVTQLWQPPLYTAGNVSKVIASASLHKKLLSLKIKANFILGLILENPALQYFDVLNGGVPKKKPQPTTVNCRTGPVTTCHLILPIWEKQSPRKQKTVLLNLV